MGFIFFVKPYTDPPPPLPWAPSYMYNDHKVQVH